MIIMRKYINEVPTSTLVSIICIVCFCVGLFGWHKFVSPTLNSTLVSYSRNHIEYEENKLMWATIQISPRIRFAWVATPYVDTEGTIKFRQTEVLQYWGKYFSREKEDWHSYNVLTPKEMIDQLNKMEEVPR